MRVFVCAGGILKEDIVMLNFMPELKESDFCSQHEFVFIIDRSGEHNPLGSTRWFFACVAFGS